MTEQTEKTYAIDFYGKELSIRTGKIAKQAAGAVIVKTGETEVLVTVCTSPAREGQDFFPLSVEYRESYYAAGKIPGGFLKRESRPSTKEILTCRMTDRPLRPLFPKDFLDEVQIIGQVVGHDKQNEADVLAMVGASAALSISKLPFQEPCGAVRVGMIDGKYIVNPTLDETAKSDIDLIVAGTRENVTMVEAGAKEVSEEQMLNAIWFGHEAIQQLIDLQLKMVDELGDEKMVVEDKPESPWISKVADAYAGKVSEVNLTPGKHARYDAIDALKAEVVDALSADIVDEEEKAAAQASIKDAFKEVLRRDTRATIIKGHRLDGRKTDEIRPITCDVGYVNRQHGSAVFTRGETQAMVSATLGAGKTDQIVETLAETISQKFYLHYNFPPYCVGETGRFGAPKRREIGHGNLAERALVPVVPNQEEFPYNIRIVSDITESNGSSSMASVCGGCLAMMDAGVPIKDPVAGIAMGLISDGSNYAILSDIQGEEDHEGDMDFKVTGTQHGITAIQMDIKIDGLSREIMDKALDQAKEGRMHILRCMLSAIDAPREDVSEFAPALLTMQIKSDKIGAVIGPGGSIIRGLQEETGSVITIDDDGTVTIAGDDQSAAKAAEAKIRAITAEPEIGQLYTGEIKAVKDFGIFVEILPGTEGLCHISELAEGFVKNVSEHVSEGDVVTVKLIDIDSMGRLKLSKKAADPKSEGGDAEGEESADAGAEEATADA